MNSVESAMLHIIFEAAEAGRSSLALKVTPGGCPHAMACAIRNYFDIPDALRLLLVDKTGCDVPLDPALPNGRYELSAMHCPSVPRKVPTVRSTQESNDLDLNSNQYGGHVKSPENVERTQAIKELLESETAYVSGLHSVQAWYMVPDPDDAGQSSALACLSLEQRAHVYGNLSTLIDKHQEFLTKLEAAVSQAEDPRDYQVGEALIFLAQFLPAYSTYAAGAVDRAKVLRVILANAESRFTAFVQFHEHVLGLGGQPLQLLLRAPLERLPAYGRLLAVLVATTPTAAGLDGKNIALTHSVISSTIQNITTQRHNAEVQKIEHLVGFKLVQPGRVFVRKGLLTRVYKPSEHLKKAKFNFYLFNDHFMFGKYRDRKFVEVTHLPITKTERFKDRFKVERVDPGTANYEKMFESTGNGGVLEKVRRKSKSWLGGGTSRGITPGRASSSSAAGLAGGVAPVDLLVASRAAKLLPKQGFVQIQTAAQPVFRQMYCMVQAGGSLRLFESQPNVSVVLAGGAATTQAIAAAGGCLTMGLQGVQMASIPADKHEHDESADEGYKFGDITRSAIKGIRDATSTNAAAHAVQLTPAAGPPLVLACADAHELSEWQEAIKASEAAPVEVGNQHWCFKILTNKLNLYIEATDKGSMQQWMEDINWVCFLRDCDQKWRDKPSA